MDDSWAVGFTEHRPDLVAAYAAVSIFTIARIDSTWYNNRKVAAHLRDEQNQCPLEWEAEAKVEG